MKPYVLSATFVLVAALAFWLWTPDKSMASLESTYLRDPHDKVRIAGWQLRLCDSGPRDAPAVILLHGFGASLETWDALSETLSRDHRVIRFDLPGSGLSAPDPAGDYTDARSIALLLEVMASLGLQRATIVGHSIGGRIAWTFAALHPERVDRLVLIAPDGFASPGFAYGKPADVPAVMQAMRFVLPTAVLRMNLAPAYADPSLPTDAMTRRYRDLMLAPGSRQALLQRMTQTVLVDPVPLLRRIQAPTLLVWGERDAMIPFANSADYLRAVPQARLVEIPATGHVPQEESPRRLSNAVADFLRTPTGA